MKGFKISLLLIAILSAFAIILTGCGGGGGGGETAQQEATLTSTDAPASAGAVFQAGNFSGLSEGFSEFGGIGIATASLKPQSKLPLMYIFDKVVSIAKSQIHKSQIRVAGSMPPTTESCSAGGTITVSATWTGPDNPTDPSQVVDFTATATFSSCKLEDTTTMNGTMNIAFKGPLSAFTSLKVSTSSFKYVDTDEDHDITMTNLTIDFTDITFNGDEITGCTITLSGAVSGTVGDDPINQEYDKFKMVLNHATGTTASISGRLKASCLGGWVTVATNTPVFFPENADCPRAGEIVVTSSGNRVKIVIASDSKITVYYNDADPQIYNNCEDVDGFCAG